MTMQRSSSEALTGLLTQHIGDALASLGNGSIHTVFTPTRGKSLAILAADFEPVPSQIAHDTIMALLTILEFPDPRLRTPAKPVTEMTANTQKLIDDMFETMYAAKGIGLAATQINVHQRVVVMDLSEEHDTPLVFINPEIEPLTEEQVPYQEGCLSVPGFYEDINRPSRVRIRALDRTGTAFELEAEGLLAVCIQHECDHLNGRLFVDHLSSVKRDRIRKKLEKQQRQQA